jgi:tetratricopeptide (TPR) repeat protein
MSRIINVFALLVIAFVVLCVIGIIPININYYGLALSVIVCATALFKFSSAKFRIIKPGQYVNNPMLFIDRKNQIKKLLNEMNTNQNVINGFGTTGVGVTHLMQFTADIINHKIPREIHQNYCEFKATSKYRGYYVSFSDVAGSDNILSIMKSATGITTISTVGELCRTLNKKCKYKQLVFFFDGIKNSEQRFLLEEFIAEYFPLRPNDCFVAGTHQEVLSYKTDYQCIEIPKFDKNDLMILAKAHNVNTSENIGLQLYRITDGMPLFACLLLKNNNALDLVNNHEISNIYNYLKKYVIPSLSHDEQVAMGKIALISFSSPVLSQNELDLIGLTDHNVIDSLHHRGLIQAYDAGKRIIIPQIIAKVFFVKSHEDCERLYEYYKENGRRSYAVLYLLLSEKPTEDKKHYFDESIKSWMHEKDILSILSALTPSIDFEVEVKEYYRETYVSYIYCCIHMLSFCGDYQKAKKLLDCLCVDGDIIQRYDSEMDDANFNLHFLWADVEHLLNHYEEAIEIIRALIINSNQYNDTARLPQLYWMQAHCMRHEAKHLDESLKLYVKCEGEALRQNNSEYLIRALHGQICIALIIGNRKFAFMKTFERLNTIYEQEPERWNSYKYNTLKYKSIYRRIYFREQEISLSLLKQAQKGFQEIKKRNLYDIYFEMGEYYRDFGDYENAHINYNRCIEFSNNNSDYNLESLSELGKILTDGIIEKNQCDRYEQLQSIIRKAGDRNLNLSVNYAKVILSGLQNNEADFRMFLLNP